MVEEDEYLRFRRGLEDLQARGEYFYSITMYIYCGRWWLSAGDER